MIEWNRSTPLRPQPPAVFKVPIASAASPGRPSGSVGRNCGQPSLSRLRDELGDRLPSRAASDWSHRYRAGVHRAGATPSAASKGCCRPGIDGAGTIAPCLQAGGAHFALALLTDLLADLRTAAPAFRRMDGPARDHAAGGRGGQVDIAIPLGSVCPRALSARTRGAGMAMLRRRGHPAFHKWGAGPGRAARTWSSAWAISSRAR